MNANIDTEVLDSFLKPLELKIAKFAHRHGFGIVDNVFGIVNNNERTITCVYENGFTNMYICNIERMLLDLCMRIIAFNSYVEDKSISNPYFGCKTIEEMEIKRDLLSI